MVWQREGTGDTMDPMYLWYRKQAAKWLIGPGFADKERPGSATIVSKEAGKKTVPPYSPAHSSWLSVTAGEWKEDSQISVVCIDEKYDVLQTARPTELKSAELKSDQKEKQMAPPVDVDPKSDGKPKAGDAAPQTGDTIIIDEDDL